MIDNDPVFASANDEPPPKNPFVVPRVLAGQPPRESGSEPDRAPCIHRGNNPFPIPAIRAYYTCELGLGEERGPDKIRLVCECASQPGGCIGCTEYVAKADLYDSISTAAGEISIRAAEPFRSQDRAIVHEVIRDDCYQLADLRAADVIVDIGAHVGSFAAFAHKVAPNARIVTAEACPDNWRTLERNVGRFAEVFRGAITNQPGPVRLANSIHADGSTTGGSIVLDDAVNLTSGHRLDPRPIAARTFAQFLDDRHIDRVNVLKVDCEGGEYDVLASPAIYRCNLIVGEWHGGRAKIEAAVARLAGFRLEVLSESADGDQGIFRLRNPAPSPAKFTRRTLDIYSDAFGIGDAITGMYAAAGLANLGHRVRFRSRKAEWLREISHPLVEVLPFAEVGINFNRHYDWQIKAAQRGEIESRTEWHIANIARSFGIDPFSPSPPNESGNGRKRVIDGDYVILCPLSADPSREWPAYRWMELAARLGKKAIAFGTKEEEKRLRAMFPASVRIVAGKPPAFVFAAVEHATAVVSGDSGVAHVAGVLGVPTVAIMSQLDPHFVYGIYLSVRGLFPAVDKWGCRGCAWQTAGGYKPECRTGGCGAIASIQVDDVLRLELFGK